MKSRSYLQAFDDSSRQIERRAGLFRGGVVGMMNNSSPDVEHLPRGLTPRLVETAGPECCVDQLLVFFEPVLPGNPFQLGLHRRRRKYDRSPVKTVQVGPRRLLQLRISKLQRLHLVDSLEQ